MEKINILVFSASARKIWGDYKKALNHVYFLLAYLTTKLTDDFNVYSIKTSFDPVGDIKRYRGERVDVLLSLGATYNPATNNVQLNAGFPPHERAFEIGYITKAVIKKFAPYHINFAVDEMAWFPRLTEVFGTTPDYIISEDEMKWQVIGYTLNKQLYEQQKRVKKRDVVLFVGGLKKRKKLLSDIIEDMPIKILIHGGGWEKLTFKNKLIKTFGFQKYLDSLKTQISAKYGILINDKSANKITSRMFEYFGTQTVAFVVGTYDSGNEYFPANYILRVNSGAEIMELIKTYGYGKLLKYQNEIIKPEWDNFDDFYTKPIINKIKSVWDERNK